MRSSSSREKSPNTNIYLENCLLAVSKIQNYVDTKWKSVPRARVLTHHVGVEFIDLTFSETLKAEQNLKESTGLILGISFDCALLFSDLFGLSRSSQPMWEVVSEVIKPLTAPTKCFLRDIFKGVCLRGQPLLAPATAFHSYTWMEPFQATLCNLFTGLEKDEVVGPKTVYVWWDISGKTSTSLPTSSIRLIVRLLRLRSCAFLHQTWTL
jgi:hypothetical protein